MTVPDYQSLMLPLLKITVDGNELTLSEAVETLAQQFHLEDQDRKELLPGGKQRKFDNRVHWARTYLASQPAYIYRKIEVPNNGAGYWSPQKQPTTHQCQVSGTISGIC